MTKLLTVKEAAAQLSVAAATVYSLCANGHLAHSRIGIGRGTIRIKQSELDALIQQSEVTAQSAPAGQKDWLS